MVPLVGVIHSVTHAANTESLVFYGADVGIVLTASAHMPLANASHVAVCLFKWAGKCSPTVCAEERALKCLCTPS